MAKKPVQPQVADNPQPEPEEVESVPEPTIVEATQEEIQQKAERISLANRRRFLTQRREMKYEELQKQPTWTSKKPK